MQIEREEDIKNKSRNASIKTEVSNMKLFNETEGARNGSPIVEIVVYALVIFLLYTLL